MKKIVVIIVAIAFMPFVSIGVNNTSTDNPHNPIEKLKSHNDDDWEKAGSMEVYKKVGANNAYVSQTVQVYRNSEGTRAIKNGSRYNELIENSWYHRHPDDECFECRYAYKVFYRDDYWYTNGIVKKTYGYY